MRFQGRFPKGGDFMSAKTICLLAVLVVFVYPAAASTYYVGGCKSGSFATISAAVTAAPAGSTIMICAGNYIDQVIISKDLTLKGLDSATAAGAYVYSTDSMQTTTSPIDALNTAFGPIAPVIWVTAGTVNIENVFAFGYGDAACPPRIVGFYYATGASGTLNHVGFYAGGCAVGIWAENASFTQTAVTVENSYSAAGIVAGSLLVTDGTLTVTIKDNQVFPIAPEGFVGIYLSSVSGTIETNLVSGPRWSSNGSGVSGLWLYGIADVGVSQTDVTISGNTIQNDSDGGSGIFVNLAGATVKGNKISGFYSGIELNCIAATVSGNTLSNGAIGLSDAPVGFTGVNTFYNVPIKSFEDCD
jgi:parallel beta helix pectate lyase-like protein